MKDYTHICIVLDASGSMSWLETETKKNFNEFLNKQREFPGKTVFDLYQFSDRAKRIVERVDLSTFQDDLMENYHCNGCTALNDAVCIAIDTLGQELAAMPESERPEHVLFVIITDGMENASREYSAGDVKNRIRHQTEVYSWEFDYLAANQDAFATGAELGLSSDSCMNFCASPTGIQGVTAYLCERSFSIRQKSRRKK